MNCCNGKREGEEGMHVFIEGLQGSGKSTLLQRFAERYPHFHPYREGDYCPVELAWCSYMDQEAYEAVLARYPSLEEEIRRWTVREEGRFIVQYTRILTDTPGFHKDMEKYEIYNGRVDGKTFQTIILQRYEQLAALEPGEGNLYECAFFQNIMEEFLLYQQLGEEEILDFYKRLYAVVEKKRFCLYYLYEEEPEACVEQICRERSDEEGNQLWYLLMMEYLKNSPYGKAHRVQGFADLLLHLENRQKLEMRVIREILGNSVRILPAKRYADSDLTLPG